MRPISTNMVESGTNNKPTKKLNTGRRSSEMAKRTAQTQFSRKLIALCASMACLGLGTGVRAQGLDDASAPKQTPNFVTDDMLLNADKDASNWLLYGRDYATTRYALQTEINQQNVKKLVPKWELSFGVLDGQDSQAVAVNGTVYVTSSYNRVWALDGRTGEIKWKYERELPADVFPELCCDVVNRGVAVYGNKV